MQKPEGNFLRVTAYKQTTVLRINSLASGRNLLVSEGLAGDYSFLGVFAKIPSYTEASVVLCGFALCSCLQANTDVSHGF